MLNRVFAVLLMVCVPALCASSQEPDNVGHTHHTHHHNPKHDTEAPTPGRFTTSRASDIVLPLPEEKDAFTFVVFGDRTGGPVDGVRVLAEAVRDTNLFEPDMVMTVGDLINGYNGQDEWMAQMREFKTIMDELRCPWFPVAGNHDVYWRGPGRPKFEHDANYEMHFGPLWYAFVHKRCWFIALYSDETNPKTGEKDFNKPANHTMSEEQFEWLKSVLAKAKGAEHVFIFLHHPRWTGGNYGNEWDRVHELLVSAGNVTAVFAGHIHRMRYDPKDGIEYVTLATVGGHQSGEVPNAGYLHQYHIITVRRKQVAMASIPVGEAMNVREITGEFTQHCLTQSRVMPVFSGAISPSAGGAASGTIRVDYANTTPFTLEVTLGTQSEDSRWYLSPDHVHRAIAPGENASFELFASRDGGGLDAAYAAPMTTVNADVLMPTARYPLPQVEREIPVDLDHVEFPAIVGDPALVLDGDDALLVSSEECNVPDGPLTIECWLNAEEFGARTGLLCKTEQSDYGVFVNNGRPEFSVFLGSAYTKVKAEMALTSGRWYHIAGVFDGSEVRLYVDGTIAGRANAKGKRKIKSLPLAVGADVGGDGSPNSFFKGRIDAVRLSRDVEYVGDSFTPTRRVSVSPGTVFSTNMDRRIGNRIFGTLGDREAWLGAIRGNPRVVSEN